MNNSIYEKSKEYLEQIGYIWSADDTFILALEVQNAESTIKNNCNLFDIPQKLLNIAVNMSVGKFLNIKKTFEPNRIMELDLSCAVKQIQAGDTNTVFALGSGSLTDEQRFDLFVNYLLTCGKDELSCYRKIKW